MGWLLGYLYLVLQISKVCLAPSGWEVVLSGLSDSAPARWAQPSLCSHIHSHYCSTAEEAQCTVASPEQQEEQRTVPFHGPQYKLSLGYFSRSGIQENTVCRHTQVRQTQAWSLNVSEIFVSVIVKHLVWTALMDQFSWWLKAEMEPLCNLRFLIWLWQAQLWWWKHTNQVLSANVHLSVQLHFVISTPLEKHYLLLHHILKKVAV